MNRGRKLRRSPNGTPIALGRESVLAYVKAIAGIYSKQKALGLNSHDPARGPLVRTFLDTLEKEKVKSKRQYFEDRGKNTLNDGYIKQIMETFCQVFSVYDPALLNKNNSVRIVFVFSLYFDHYIVGQIINTNGRFSTFQIVQTFIILYL